MYRLYIIFILLAFPLNNLLSQTMDTATIQKCYPLAMQALRQANWDKAISYTDTIYAISKKGNYTPGITISLTLKGEAYQNKGDLKLAYQCYSQNLHFMDSIQYDGDVRGRLYKDMFILFSIQQEEDSARVYRNKIFDLPCKKSTIIAKHYIAQYLFDNNKIADALSWSRQNINCAQGLETHSIKLSTFNLMSSIYQSIGDYETAMLFTDSLLQTAIHNKDSLFTLVVYDNLGIINTRLENYPKSLEWFKKAMHLGETLSEHKKHYQSSKLLNTKIPLGDIYSHIAAAYQNLSRFDSINIYTDSIDHYSQKALKAHYNNNDYWNVSLQLVNMAKNIADQKNYTAALDSLQKAYKLAPRHHRWKIIQYHIYSTKGEIYTNLKTFDKAKIYLDSATLITTTLNDTSKLVSVYELWEKFYIATQNYKKAYEYEALANTLLQNLKKKENLKIVSNLEIKYNTEQIKRENLELEKNNELQAQELAFNAKLNTRNTYIIIGLIVLLLLLIGIGFLIHKQNKLHTQFKIMKLEQKALKAQINPHFFFNVLNSLQGTILSEKPMVAYAYHTKFTKLMRLILIQSDSEGITLNEEIDALGLYLELEQLRTGNAFDFEIINNVKESSSPLMVPSMLLQPFAENAIWHGVMNREDDENKKITIQINNKGQHIVCEIEDTGVGRKQAEIIKKQKTNKHKSMGMQVTQNRLELFQLRYKTPLSFTIQDLTNSKGLALGTKVTLKIPFLK